MLSHEKCGDVPVVIRERLLFMRRRGVCQLCLSQEKPSGIGVCRHRQRDGKCTTLTFTSAKNLNFSMMHPHQVANHTESDTQTAFRAGFGAWALGEQFKQVR